MVMEEEAVALQETCHALPYFETLESNAQGLGRSLHLNRHSALWSLGRQLDRDDLVKVRDTRKLKSKRNLNKFLSQVQDMENNS